jgi:hypothetical protein
VPPKVREISLSWRSGGAMPTLYSATGLPCLPARSSQLVNSTAIDNIWPSRPGSDSLHAR